MFVVFEVILKFSETFIHTKLFLCRLSPVTSRRFDRCSHRCLVQVSLYISRMSFGFLVLLLLFTGTEREYTVSPQALISECVRQVSGGNNRKQSVMVEDGSDR